MSTEIKEIVVLAKMDNGKIHQVLLTTEKMEALIYDLRTLYFDRYTIKLWDKDFSDIILFDKEDT